MSRLADQISVDGYAIVRDLLTEEHVQQLRFAVERARESDHPAAVRSAGGVFGLRNLVEVLPEVTSLVDANALTDLLRQLFDQPAFLVRATLFDKTEDANWGVFWHQDRSIAVSQRIAVSGFDGWTRKAGVDCVRPPAEVMKRIRAVRLHLDDCGEPQGALRVLPGTHGLNHCGSGEIQQQQAARQQVVCEVRAGDAVIMCPLLLHASSPMTAGTRRRVLHLEFADFALPAPLQWSHSNPWRKSA